MALTYPLLRELVADRDLPLALVDLDAFDRNVDEVVMQCRTHGRTLRVASKSIRCRALLERVRERAGDRFAGLMAYDAREAAWLSRAGFTDVLVGYPTARANDAAQIARANRDGATVSAMVDDLDQVRLLALAARAAGTVVPCVVDVDLAVRALGGRVHLGVRRSPLHDARSVVAMADVIRGTDGVNFHGVMGYEAQVAGLTDSAKPGGRLDPAAWLVKRASSRSVPSLRHMIETELRAHGHSHTLHNGGGSGSLAFTLADPCVTEVTVGSRFVGSHLFDRYRDFRPRPALLFALQIARRPDASVVTCHGGGYIASGPPASDRLPQPYLPEGGELLALEGAGEVQTPVRFPPEVRLNLGDPVFFRPAKAGELAERFTHYLLVADGVVTAEVPTYRGEGGCYV